MINISELLTEMKIEHKISGDSEVEYLALLESEIKGDICSFLSSEKFIPAISNKIKVLLVNNENSSKVQNKVKTVCTVKNPQVVFFLLHNYLSNKDFYQREMKETEKRNERN